MELLLEFDDLVHGEDDRDVAADDDRGRASSSLGFVNGVRRSFSGRVSRPSASSMDADDVGELMTMAATSVDHERRERAIRELREVVREADEETLSLVVVELLERAGGDAATAAAGSEFEGEREELEERGVDIPHVRCEAVYVALAVELVRSMP